MEWTDDAIILHAERYGEGDAVVELMTRAHGRHRGYVKGGMSRRRRADLQPGNQIEATWRARLHSQLGHLSIEVIRARVANLMAVPSRLAAFGAAASVLIVALPERETHERIFAGLVALLDLLESEDAGPVEHGAALVALEIGILSDLGFGLDLESCASTSQTDDLIYVSPKSGRAVSAAAGAPYVGRLLELPQFLLGDVRADKDGVLAGLSLSGHFIERHVLTIAGRDMPAARGRFVAMFSD